MSQREDPATGFRGIVYAVYAAAVLLPAAALVVFLVGSLIFSGGQAGPNMSVKWGVMVDYPLFPMPTVVLVSVAGVAAVCAAIVAVASRGYPQAQLRGLVGPSAAAIVCSYLFALFVPDGPGGPGGLGGPDGTASVREAGTQWVAAPIFAAALALIGLALLAHALRHGRATPS